MWKNTHNIIFTILTIASIQFRSVKYIYIVVQPIFRIFFCLQSFLTFFKSHFLACFTLPFRLKVSWGQDCVTEFCIHYWTDIINNCFMKSVLVFPISHLMCSPQDPYSANRPGFCYQWNSAHFQNISTYVSKGDGHQQS